MSARNDRLDRQGHRPAQLHGFIERIGELGLELLVVERLGEPT
jgi:hypothetical protein